MAERRMFAKTIIDSDAFLDMPITARLLYYDLGMRADDDGFVNSPKKIMRMIGASDGDLQALLDKRFVILFESGVVVIKHWRIHNYIQKDRYKPTKYQDEFNELSTKENGAYTLDTTCIQDVDRLDTQVRLGKDSLGKSNKDEESADVEAIVLNDSTTWKPSKAQLDEYIRLYPGVDVYEQFRLMRAWSISNPSKRKTIRGVSKFVNGWLSRTQDRPQNRPYKKVQSVPEYMVEPYTNQASDASNEQLQKEIKEMLEKMKNESVRDDS